MKMAHKFVATLLQSSKRKCQIHNNNNNHHKNNEMQKMEIVLNARSTETNNSNTKLLYKVFSYKYSFNMHINGIYPLFSFPFCIKKNVEIVYMR